MVRPRELPYLPVLDEPSLLKSLLQLQLKPIHVSTIWGSIVNKEDVSFSSIPNLPATLYPHLSSHFLASTSTLVTRKDSLDGLTTKLLLRLQDGHMVEAVIMRHDASNGKHNKIERGGGQRSTLCVSSQVGCQMGCTFCATGTMGLKANLLAGEIVEQVFHALRVSPIRNIVFMGMGEPLNNYEAVKQSIRSITSYPFFGISSNHITVSTVGVVPRMLSFAEDLPGVNLALSLHAPSQSTRAKIVPSARAYNLDKVMAAMDHFQRTSGRSVLVEYVLLKGINDSLEDAHALGALLREKMVVVNLIPYNPTSVKMAFEPSDREQTAAFQKIVRTEYGLRTTVRQEMGQDISGACGQLVVDHHISDNRQSMEGDCNSSAGAGVGGDLKSIRDIEDLVH